MFSISDIPAQDLTRSYKICGPSGPQTKTSCWELAQLADAVAEQRFRIVGHILRLTGHRPSKIAMSRIPDDGRWRRGRLKTTWRRTFQEDLTRANITCEEVEHTAMDRPVWRQADAQLKRSKNS